MGDARAGGEWTAFSGFAVRLPPAAILGAYLGAYLQAPALKLQSQFLLPLRLISPESCKASMQRGESFLPAARMHWRSCELPTA